MAQTGHHTALTQHMQANMIDGEHDDAGQIADLPTLVDNSKSSSSETYVHGSAKMPITLYKDRVPIKIQFC